MVHVAVGRICKVVGIGCEPEFFVKKLIEHEVALHRRCAPGNGLAQALGQAIDLKQNVLYVQLRHSLLRQTGRRLQQRKGHIVANQTLEVVKRRRDFEIERHAAHSTVICRTAKPLSRYRHHQRRSKRRSFKPEAHSAPK